MTLSSPPYKFALALQGVAADLPSGSDYPEEALFWATDTTTLYVNDGTTFNAVGGGGSGITAWGQTSTAKYVGSGSPVSVVTPDHEGDLYVDDTTPALWEATGVADTDWQLVGGGSGSWPTYTGSGSPVGSVSAAAIGNTYADTTNGAVWVAHATGSANWISVGGYLPSFSGAGVILDADANKQWAVLDPASSTAGLLVQTAAQAGTPGPPAFTGNNTLDDGITGAASFSGPVAATSAGAPAATRLCGATVSGAPTTGAYLLGDFIVDPSVPAILVCTVAGTPGTWAPV